MNPMNTDTFLIRYWVLRIKFVWNLENVAASNTKIRIIIWRSNTNSIIPPQLSVDN